MVGAKRKESDTWLIKRWLLHYSPTMSLDDFKHRTGTAATGDIDTSLTEAEIMADVEAILKQARG